MIHNRSLVGSVVIDVEFGRNDYGPISRNYEREETETTWCQSWPFNQIKSEKKPGFTTFINEW
jgi:hypothetical protein